MTDVHRLIRQIRERRAALGLTQAEAAERAGVQRAQWAHAENGTREPRLELLERMAAAVGLELSLRHADGYQCAAR